MQTFCVPGAPPRQAVPRLYNIAFECLQAGLDTLTPGIAARDIEAPALAILGRQGLGNAFKMRLGYGVEIGFPPTWLKPLKITRTSTDHLHPGTCFVLHACLLYETESLGVLVGGTWLMADNGAELLSGAGDVELLADD